VVAASRSSINRRSVTLKIDGDNGGTIGGKTVRRVTPANNRSNRSDLFIPCKAVNVNTSEPVRYYETSLVEHDEQ